MTAPENPYENAVDTTAETTPPAEEKGARKSSRIPGTAWALVLGAVLIAGAGGFFLGQQTTATSTVLGREVAAGTNFSGPRALDSGLYDATIHGPGGPLTDPEDITVIHRRDDADPFAIGALDAPIVISEFSDTECPFCARHTRDTEHQIIERYVDAGLVRIEWNDMPINGDASVGGAKAVRAAAEQGKFHEFKTELYANHPTAGGHPDFGVEDYVHFAETVGVPDIELFRAHATDTTFDAAIAEARSYGQQIGITGTPSFVVGSQYLSGAQPYPNFERAILGELAMLGLSSE
ncbi:thioredoxin domain-containing protein [uncultured Corynebacterium sp.]|uniref:DsbA family protein n=1 Tax=uncultured Corynebacterium sp. TaxID=159447 RepID=UPI0025D9528B|nr:thioredoxin domain-containing protein [uncultured Corynebacterium sp.]